MSSRGEPGYTLIELLVATVILGIISFALTESVISGFNNTGATEERLVASLDRQRVTTAFVSDVQSMQAEDGSDKGVPCGSAPAYPDDLLINVRWTDEFDKNVATYLSRTINGETKLVRRFCINGAQLDDDEVLADIVGSVDFEAPKPGALPVFLLRVCPPEPEGTQPPCPAPTYEVAATRRAS